MLKHDAYVFYCIYKVIYWERARAPMYYARRVYVHALWLFECRNMENRNINEAQDVVSSHFVSLYQIFVIFDCTFLIHNATAAAATSVFRIVCSFLCAAHTHSVLAFVFLSFCFLISFDAVVVVVVSFILCPFVAACNLLVAFTYRALLFLFKLLENLPEYKYSHSLPHPSASSKYTGYVYRSILQHPNRTRTNRTTLRELCVCVSEYMYYRRSNSSAASFGGSCDVFAIVVLFSHSFSMYFGAALLATVAPPPPPCKCRYLCCCSTSYALML